MVTEGTKGVLPLPSQSSRWVAAAWQHPKEACLNFQAPKTSSPPQRSLLPPNLDLTLSHVTGIPSLHGGGGVRTQGQHTMGVCALPWPMSSTL